jgi:preprotein translocase subunit SecD
LRSDVLAKPPAHGTRFVLSFNETNSAAGGMERLKTVFQKRLSRFGTRGFVEAISTNELQVMVPNNSVREMAVLRDLLATGGELEMRMVHEESDLLIRNGGVVAGYERMVVVGVPGEQLVKISAEFSGPHIERATFQQDPVSGRPEIVLKFDAEGAKAFSEVTERAVGKNLAIVLDGKILTAPRISEPIRGGMAVITGGYKPEEAIVIAALLENPLPFPVTVKSFKAY